MSSIIRSSFVRNSNNFSSEISYPDLPIEVKAHIFDMVDGQASLSSTNNEHCTIARTRIAQLIENLGNRAAEYQDLAQRVLQQLPARLRDMPTSHAVYRLKQINHSLSDTASLIFNNTAIEMDWLARCTDQNVQTEMSRENLGLDYKEYTKWEFVDASSIEELMDVVKQGPFSEQVWQLIDEEGHEFTSLWYQLIRWLGDDWGETLITLDLNSHIPHTIRIDQPRLPLDYPQIRKALFSKCARINPATPLGHLQRVIANFIQQKTINLLASDFFYSDIFNLLIPKIQRKQQEDSLDSLLHDMYRNSFINEGKISVIDVVEDSERADALSHLFSAEDLAKERGSRENSRENFKKWLKGEANVSGPFSNAPKALDLKKIAIVRRGDLSYLPDEMQHLSNLEELRLPFNRFISIPSWIGNLTRLKVLDLSDNGIRTLPKEMSQLKDLRILNLSRNYALEDISAIAELTALKICLLFETSVVHFGDELLSLIPSITALYIVTSNIENLLQTSPLLKQSLFIEYTADHEVSKPLNTYESNLMHTSTENIDFIHGTIYR